MKKIFCGSGFEHYLVEVLVSSTGVFQEPKCSAALGFGFEIRFPMLLVPTPTKMLMQVKMKINNKNDFGC